MTFDSSSLAWGRHPVLVFWIMVLGGTVQTCGAERGETKRPNVVVILTDDQGWGDLSVNGNPDLSTPNIDSLARDGAALQHFYVCPVCSPTRAEFLTGRYHTRMGVYSTSAGGERFNAEEQTIAEAFRDAGYATGAFGKWHSGMQWPYHPNARGFDEYYGFCSGHWGHYYDPMLEHNGQIVQGKGFLPDDLTSQAIDFIGRHREDPFFVYLPLNTPHSPMQVPAEYWERFAHKELTPNPRPQKKNKKSKVADHARAALAMCENIDWNVGRLLKSLDEEGVAQDTIVVYFSDNGPNGDRFNGGLRGRKGSVYEGGLRSPLMVRYPIAVPAGQRVESITAAVDLLPTLAELAGLSFESVKPLDGVSFAGLLTGQSDADRSRVIMTHWNGKLSARNQRFRMQNDGELYDIDEDPKELVDVADQHPQVVRALRKSMDDFVSQTNPRRSNAKLQRPITIGHPRAEWTQVPARDATAHGGVARSNRFPNCTFMGNWASTEDRIEWDAEVLEAGDFEVSMWYACDQDQVGSTIQLKFGAESVTANITQPNEVPLIGEAQDRVVRMEGYVKRWKSMTLGTIHLEPGRGKLTLNARVIAGDTVGEMRLLMFRRL